jgi:hypothetical protein
MVNALREAHRVLKPGGLLIDLRPAAVHRRVGITQGGRHRLSWVMRENFDDDHAADRAVTEVVNQGWFKAEGRARFACYRVMDTLDDFREWLTDFVQKGKFPSHDWLISRVEHKLESSDDKTRIVVSAPLNLRVLRKTAVVAIA